MYMAILRAGRASKIMLGDEWDLRQLWQIHNDSSSAIVLRARHVTQGRTPHSGTDGVVHEANLCYSQTTSCITYMFASDNYELRFQQS